MTNWDSLASILEGSVGLPGSPAYDGSPPPFNARYRDVLPKAIASCATAQDVAATIAFARRHGSDLVARNGGHSLAGQSTCQGIVVDVSPRRSVIVSDGLAAVGAGARLGEVSRAADVIAAWQTWAPDAPDEMAASLKVTAGGGEGVSMDVHAAYTGDESAAEPLLTDLVDQVGVDPIASSREVLSFPETRRFWANLGQAERAALDDPIAEPVCLFAKSEFFRQPLPSVAIGRLLETFDMESASGPARELDFMPWGGAYNRVPPDATAFVHREERFQLKHAVVLEPDASPGGQEAASRQVARSWASVHPWGSGRVFQNFADPDLDPWAPAYHGPNLDRLLEVKARYDPENVFVSRAG